MTSLWSKYIRFSKKNGVILMLPNEGYTEVLAHGAKQTSSGYKVMWSDACTHHHPHMAAQDVSSVLMLGLAGGGALPAIYAVFPNAAVSTIEYDGEMIAIAQELQLQAPAPFPVVYEGDAADILPTLTNRFDIILIDLFYGLEPSALLLQEDFVQELKNKLTPQGSVIVNVCLKPQQLEIFKKMFTHAQEWHYRANTFGAFWDADTVKS